MRRGISSKFLDHLLLLFLLLRYIRVYYGSRLHYSSLLSMSTLALLKLQMLRRDL